MINNKEAISAFIDDLEVLYRKHQMVISACGCCYSPWILEQDESTHHSIDSCIKHLRYEELGDGENPNT